MPENPPPFSGANQNPPGAPPPLPPRPPSRGGFPGWAIALIVVGGVFVLAIPTLAIMAGLLLPALSKAKDKAQIINCENNLKQIGLAYRVAEGDFSDRFPFNVSTNDGGTLELGSPGSDGFDLNAWVHFRALSNEFGNTRIFVCPGDPNATPALDFEHLQAVNVTYKLHTGRGVSDANPGAVLAYCPIHNNVLLADGSVQHLSAAQAQVLLSRMAAQR